MSRALWMVACITLTAALWATAQPESAKLENFVLSTPMTAPATTRTPDLWRDFQGAFSRQIDDEFADAFHPLTTMNWSLKVGSPSDMRDRHSGAATDALSQSILYGLRQATMDLPILAWLEDRQEFLVGFFENSVGNFEEESVSPLSVSYQQAERSWWKELSDSGRIHYGIRPLRTDPYAYVSLAVKDHNRVLMLCNARYHFVNFGDHSFELAMSFPIRPGFSVDVGTSYRFGQHDDAKRVAIKLSKEFKGGSILHLGFDVRDHPTLLAGITIPM